MSARLLFRLLTLLLGSFYLNTVCQTDAEDACAYYAQECHEYVAACPGVDVAAPAAQADKVPAALLGQWAEPAPQPTFWGAAGSPAAWPWAANPPPPVRRLYLLYAVLQV